MMPVMDGFEFLDKLREDSRFARIPVYVVSAIPDHAPAGVARVIPKPFDLDMLVELAAGCTASADAPRVRTPVP
jgi:CheY-like chemotaxis protein